MGRLIIFVVDDESVISKTLAIILNQSGFTATAFENASEALAAARSTRVDVLISDVVMPKMNGIELALQLRRIYPACKVLLFSGQPETAALLANASEQGHIFDILAKPVYPLELLDTLRSLG